MIKVLSIFGTRPEAIKMCPLITELEKLSDFQSIVCLTGQHREMLESVIKVFDIKVQYNLDIMKEHQSLSDITTKIMILLRPILEDEKPDLVLVHGDTTTAFASALSCFYEKIPVGHVEAGLRTYNMYSPFPEELNRTLIARLASLHFAPTQQNVTNLNKENIDINIFQTGNTAIDALKYTVNSNYQFKDKTIQKICSNHDKKIIMVTAHRRENLGLPLENICDALSTIADKYSDMEIIFPIHPNPQIKNVVSSKLQTKSNIHLLPPIDVLEMHNLMSKCHFILTDSGGLQEEAPALNIPVIVLREESERREAAESGTVVVVGTTSKIIVETVDSLICDSLRYNQMKNAGNPYGNGTASIKIIEGIRVWWEIAKNSH